MASKYRGSHQGTLLHSADPSTHATETREAPWLLPQRLAVAPAVPAWKADDIPDVGDAREVAQ